MGFRAFFYFFLFFSLRDEDLFTEFLEWKKDDQGIDKLSEFPQFWEKCLNNVPW